MKLRELHNVVEQCYVYNETGSTLLCEIWSSKNSYPKEIELLLDKEVIFIYDYYNSLRCNIKE